MKRQVRIVSVVLMLVCFASLAAAVQKPAVQTAGTTTRLVLGAQDVITASDAGGGYLTTRDIILVVVIILALIGLGVLL